MMVKDTTFRRDDGDSTVAGLRAAYGTLLPAALSPELSRLAACLERPDPCRSADTKLAVVAGADEDARSKASALLEETRLGIVECASAEAALAVLVKEGARTVFLLADGPMAGPRDAEALAGTVRRLWPDIHVALSCGDAGERCRTDENGVARLSHPWRGLDLFVQAEKALANAP